MRTKLFLASFLLLITLLVFVQCDKGVNRKIQGTWKYIDVKNLTNKSNSQEWVFKNDTLSIVTTIQTDSSYSISAPKTAVYKVDYKKRKRWITLETSIDIFVAGLTYQIVRLDNKAMVIVVQEVQNNGKVGGYKLLELERIKE